MHKVIKNLLMEVPAFKGMNKALLNAMTENVESYIYSPGDVIVAVDVRVKGIYIISSGEVDVIDVSNSVATTLKKGEVFALNALHTSFTSSFELRAKSFAEVLYLAGTAFRNTCRLHLEAEECDNLLATTYETVEKRHRGSFVDLSRTKAIRRAPTIIKAAERHNSQNEMWTNTRLFFAEDSLFRAVWDTILMLGMFFYLTSCALLLAATVRENFLDHYRDLLLASYVFDIIFGLNIIMKALIFGYIDNGISYGEPWMVFQQFLKSNNMIIVVFANAPLDVILGVTVSFRLIPVLRLLKLLHLVNLPEYIRNFEDLLRLNFKFAISFEASRIMGLYFLLFQLCHWSGCILQLGADVSVKVYGFEQNWRIQDQASEEIDMNYAAFEGAAYYVRSMYFAISTMSSIGVGDVTVANPMETVVMFFIIFFGFLFFNTLLGFIASLISNFNAQKREFHNKVTKISELLRFRKIPQDIEAKIMRYFEYLWSRYGGVNETEILASLPRSLRSDVKNYVMGPLIAKIPFFLDCSESMQQMIVSLLEPRVFLHDECVIRMNEIGKEMFIVERGTVLVQSIDRKVTYTALNKGDYFGESSLLAVSRRTASVYANGYVDTFYLTRDIFMKVAEVYPSEYHGVLKIIKQILQAKTTMNDNIRKELEKAEGVSPSETAEQTVEAGSFKDHSKIDDKELIPSGKYSFTVPTSRHSFDKLRSPQTSFLRNLFQGDSVALAVSSNESFIYISEKKPIKKVSQSSPNYIHPDSLFKLVWDVMIFFSLMYYVIITPMRIAFEISPYIFIVDYIVDAINLCDDYLYARWFALFSCGELISESSEIFSNYISRYLLIDAVAGFPYDLIALGFLSYKPETLLFIRAILRLPKLVKMYHSPELFKQVERLTNKLHINMLLVRFLELTCGLLTISHWAACVFYLLARTRNLGSCEPEPGAIYGEACDFRSTWIQMQIAREKLPPDAGNQWERYLRAMNWATPMLASATMGDVYAVNANETLYVMLMMFCVLGVYGAIIGNIIILVANANEEVSKIYRDIERIRKYLSLHGIPKELIDTSTGMLMYLASYEGSLCVQQDELFAELPFTIRISIDQYLKTQPFLSRCPLFDFANEELLRGISSKLVRKLFCKGDVIINAGDLGHQMYFLEKGNVEVIGIDGVLYATLEEGSFFGETTVFFRRPRAASIVASSYYCFCLVLSKEDLDNEFQACDFDDEEVRQAFAVLQETNQLRNAAVARNLQLSKNPKSKLFKLIVIEEKAPISWLCRIRTTLYPKSIFRVVWDCIGLMILIYYSFSIPFYIAFLFGEKVDLYYKYIYADFLFDLYWIVDIFLKAFIFSFRNDLLHMKLITDGELIWKKYRDEGYFYVDVIASIPLEFLALYLGKSAIFSLRVNHLLRIPQLLEYSNLVERHFTRITDVYISRASSMLMKAVVAYVIINQWLACIYFMIHRYEERHRELTYIIADGLATYDPVTGKHDICSGALSMCYARTVYFVLGIMSAVGYGDISPHTNEEILWQQVVAISGAYNAAIFVGFCQAFLEDVDANSDANFKKKIRELEKYIKFRNLDQGLKDAILSHYTHVWHKYRSLSGNSKDILGKLSRPTIMALSMRLEADIMQKIPLIRDSSPQLRRRIAGRLKSQVCLIP